MTYPRSQLISTEEPGFYHCVSRFVRQAFLCGFDSVSGQDFEHRREWIEDRTLRLADGFAVAVYAYAVMSNHFHVVLRSDPQLPMQWSDREVAQRWLAIFPGSISNRDDPACVERATLALLSNRGRLAVISRRLGSVSWFMRALNEPGWLYRAVLGGPLQMPGPARRGSGSLVHGLCGSQSGPGGHVRFSSRVAPYVR